MLEAKSMYYGGELVEAIDVNLDYDSYKELGLLCPFCNEPVYLCGETLRQSQKTGKLSYIRPHFKHFPGGDPIDLGCEKRYFTPEGKQYLDALRADRKGQRLDLFNRYFLEVCVELSFGQIKKSFEYMTLRVVGAKSPLSFTNPGIKYLRDHWFEHEDAVRAAFAGELSQLWEPNLSDRMMADMEKRYQGYSKYQDEWLKASAKYSSELATLINSCDRKIHELITWEAVSFLYTKQGSTAWLGLVGLDCSIELFQFVAKNEEFDASKLKNLEAKFAGIITKTVYTPWQKRLEEKSKLKESTREKGFAKSR